MKVGRIREECNIYIENIKLKKTDKLSYLVVLLDDENEQNSDISNRINKYNANVNALYLILKDKNIPTKAKTIKFTTVLRTTAWWVRNLDNDKTIFGYTSS